MKESREGSNSEIEKIPTSVSHTSKNLGWGLQKPPCMEVNFDSEEGNTKTVANLERQAESCLRVERRKVRGTCCRAERQAKH